MSNKVPQIRFNGYSDAWVQRKFADMFAKIGDGLHGTPQYEDNGDTAFINGNNLSNGNIVISDETKRVTEGQKSIADTSLTNQTILMSINGTIGSLAWYRGENVMLGKSVAYMIPDAVDSKFAYYELQTAKTMTHFKNALTGTTIKNLGLKAIRDRMLWVPKQDEQYRIGQLLYDLDNLIAANQHKLDLLKEQKKGYLQKMFPKNGAKVPELRFAGFADDWEDRKLKDIVEKQIKGKAQFEKLAPGEVEYLDTSRLNGGQAILTNGLKDVTLDDILILWDGSKAGTVYHGFEGALGSTLKAYRTSANSKFVYQYLKRHQDNIYNNYRTPNIPHVQKDFLNVFTISVPVSDEQEKIGSFFQQLDETIDLHQRKLDLLKEQKKGFLQKMFV